MAISTELGRTHFDHPIARAVIFDMDGLLVDTEPIWRRVETGVFSELGYDISPLMGRGLTKGVRVDDAVRFFRAGIVGCDIDVDATVEVIVQRIVDNIWNDCQLLPGVHSALAFCEDHGLVTALASGSVRAVIQAVIDRFELAQHFSVVASAEDEVHGKPHPSIFLRTADLLGVAPLECVVLEDSLNGCIAAKAARMRTVAIPDERNASDPRFAIADLQLSSLEEFSSKEVVELLGLDRIRTMLS